MTDTPQEERLPGPTHGGGGISLPVPPTPENAPELAQYAVAAASKINNVDLDYSPESIQLVDEILDSFYEGGSAATMSAIVCFGCYVGEVLVAHDGYHWRETTPQERMIYGGWQMLVARDRTGSAANVIGKAHKRVENGAEDALPTFYRVMAGEPEIS